MTDLFALIYGYCTSKPMTRRFTDYKLLTGNGMREGSRGCCTTRVGVHGSDGVGTIRWAGRGGRDVGAGARRKVCQRNGAAGVQLIVHCILRLCRRDLLEVSGAGLGTGRFTSTDEVRKRDGKQDADDQNHDHDLNQRKTLAKILQILGQHNDFLSP